MVPSIFVDNLAGIAPLHHRYPGQAGPQPAYIELTEDGKVLADFNAELGNAMPAAVWHRRTLRWPLPPDVRGEALTAFLADPAALALLQRVHAGHSVEWDGSNHVGRLDEDARAASDKFAELIERDLAGDEAAVWDANEWLWANCTLLTHWQHQPLAEAVAQIEADAAVQGVLIDGDIKHELLDEAARWLESGRPGLTPAHVTALIESGRATDAEATQYAAGTGRC